jgi:hypothetical protein
MHESKWGAVSACNVNLKGMHSQSMDAHVLHLRVFKQFKKDMAAHVLHVLLQVFNQFKKDMELSSQQKALVERECEAWKTKCSLSENQVWHVDDVKCSCNVF